MICSDATHSRLFLKHTTQFCCVSVFKSACLTTYHHKLTFLQCFSVTLLVIWAVMYGRHKTTWTVPCTTTWGSSGGKTKHVSASILTVVLLSSQQQTRSTWQTVRGLALSGGNRYWTLNKYEVRSHDQGHLPAIPMPEECKYFLKCLVFCLRNLLVCEDPKDGEKSAEWKERVVLQWIL